MGGDDGADVDEAWSSIREGVSRMVPGTGLGLGIREWGVGVFGWLLRQSMTEE